MPDGHRNVPLLVGAIIAAEVLLGLGVGVSGADLLVPALALVAFPLVCIGGFVFPEGLLALFLFAGAFTVGTTIRVDVGFFLGLALLVVVIGRASDGRMPRIPVGVWLFVALVLLAVVGVAYSPARTYGIDKVIRLATLGLLATFAPLVLLRAKGAVPRFYEAVIAIAGTLALYAVVASAAFGRSGRLVAFGGGPITLGRAAALAVGGCLVFVGWRRSSAWWALPVGLVSLWALLGSAARGPGLALLGAFLALAVVSVFRLRVSRPVVVAAVVALVVIGTGIWQVAGSVGLERYSILVSGDFGTSGAARISAAQESLQLARTHPLSGVGTGGFSAYQPWLMYPHNILLEVGAELGFLALGLALAVILAAFGSAVGQVLSRSGLETNLLFVWLAVTFANSLVSGDLNDNQMLYAMMALAMSGYCVGVRTATGSRHTAPAVAAGDG